VSVLNYTSKKTNLHIAKAITSQSQTEKSDKMDNTWKDNTRQLLWTDASYQLALNMFICWRF